MKYDNYFRRDKKNGMCKFFHISRSLCNLKRRADISVSRWVTASLSNFVYVTKFDRGTKTQTGVLGYTSTDNFITFFAYTLHKYSSYSTLEPTSYITCGKAAKIQLVSATYKRFTIVFVRYICTCKHDDEMYHKFFVYFFFTELYIRNFTRVTRGSATMLATDINIKD